MVLESCSLVAAEGFSGFGACLSEAFFGDPTLTTIGVLGIFAFVAYKMNFPHEVSIMFGIALVFVMTIVMQNAAMYPLIVLAVIILTIYFVRGIFKPAKR